MPLSPRCSSWRKRGVAAQGEVSVGKPFTEILAARAACQADLIVMGSRGDSGIGRALVGGVAQKVMGLSEQPVMVLNFSIFQGDFTMSDALNYLLKARPETMGHYFAFLKEAANTSTPRPET